jgi:outer membrane protein OmpA-like peptidoglycan-associated protein
VDAYTVLAGTHLELKNYVLAEKYLQDAITLAPDYDPKAYFFLGQIQMELDKYKEAATNFDICAKSPKISATRLRDAKKFAADALFTDYAMQHPVPYQPKSLGNLINTKFQEYLPSLTADGETLVYTVVINRQEDLYASKRVDSVWQRGTPLNNINTEDNEGGQCISADGRFLVFTGCQRPDGKGQCDLYYSYLINGKWSEPLNMGAPINTTSWESQPSLSADGNTLYFSSDRPGGKGGYDLYQSHRTEGGKWSIPTNLGDTLNTEFNDQAPFLHQDGQTLFFTSDGHPGMGKNDLFLSRLDPLTGTWGKPQNLGYPINTKESDGTLVVSLDGKTAYFARGKKAMTAGIPLAGQDKEGMLKIPNDFDLYSFDLYPEVRPKPVTYLKATIVDATTQQPITSAKLEFIDLVTGKVVIKSYSNEAGEALACLPFGKDYAMNVTKANYVFHSDNFNLSDSGTFKKPFTRKVSLQAILKPSARPTTNGQQPATNAQPIVLKNVFFETGIATLRQESKSELNRLKTLLEENPSMKIRIQGHTDNVGNDAANQTLSENRAKSVYDFLIQNGIPSTRLSYKGFGKTQPIDTNDTDSGRQNNRRTEFVVVE